MLRVKTKHFNYGQTEISYLKKADPVLGEAMERIGRVERIIIPDLFPALIYAIVGQLISVKTAQTIWMRMQDKFGDITPDCIASQTADEIQSCGITMKKAICIKNISETIAIGNLDLNELHSLSDSQVMKKLTLLDGIGEWTAEMLLINSMERPDVVSWGDLAIRRGMCKLYGLKDISKEQFQKHRNIYSPYGSTASIYLWQISFQ